MKTVSIEDTLLVEALTEWLTLMVQTHKIGDIKKEHEKECD